MSQTGRGSSTAEDDLARQATSVKTAGEVDAPNAGVCARRLVNAPAGGVLGRAFRATRGRRTNPRRASPRRTRLARSLTDRGDRPRRAEHELSELTLADESREARVCQIRISQARARSHPFASRSQARWRSMSW